MEFVTLTNKVKMPMEGFGVFQVRDKEECRRSVLDAIRTGYRLIDTAASYTNEDAVGEAVRDAIAEGICTREELFITSKMWVQDMESYETAKRAIDASLEKSGLEYLDLYLLHQAMKDYFSAWRAMEDAYREGKLKAVGVSNFYPHVLTNFCETVKIRPMVNQVELHPYYTAGSPGLRSLRGPPRSPLTSHSQKVYSALLQEAPRLPAPRHSRPWSPKPSPGCNKGAAPPG